MLSDFQRSMVCGRSLSFGLLLFVICLGSVAQGSGWIAAAQLEQQLVEQTSGLGMERRAGFGALVGQDFGAWGLREEIAASTTVTEDNTLAVWNRRWHAMGWLRFRIYGGSSNQGYLSAGAGLYRQEVTTKFGEMESSSWGQWEAIEGLGIGHRVSLTETWGFEAEARWLVLRWAELAFRLVYRF